MIVEFSLSNFRSFNNIQTVSFRATGLVSEDKETDLNNILEIDGNRLLKTIGVYGANGSGKSNLVKGLRIFKRIISRSLDATDTGRDIDPFNNISSDNGGYFQIVLILNAKKYRYGFTLNLNGDIRNEWLYGPADKNETYYYKRSGQEINVNNERFSEGLNIPYDKLKNDALFLSFCSSYNGIISSEVRSYISNNIMIENNVPKVPSYIRRNRSMTLTDGMIQNGDKEIVLNWMKEGGLPYTDIAIKMRELDNDYFIRNVILYKNIFDLNGNAVGTIPMDLDANESSGTQKFYSYIGIMQDKFKLGGLYVADEIDSNFHPSLLVKLIRIFNNPNINKAGAQLLFTSHETTLMTPEVMRRDQFYFTEKTITDETRLYSLADLKGIRNNADFARQYLAGFYGALPALGNYIEQSNHKE